MKSHWIFVVQNFFSFRLFLWVLEAVRISILSRLLNFKIASIPSITHPEWCERVCYANIWEERFNKRKREFKGFKMCLKKSKEARMTTWTMERQVEVGGTEKQVKHGFQFVFWVGLKVLRRGMIWFDSPKSHSGWNIEMKLEGKRERRGE